MHTQAPTSKITNPKSEFPSNGAGRELLLLFLLVFCYAQDIVWDTGPSLDAGCEKSSVGAQYIRGVLWVVLSDFRGNMGAGSL